MLSAAELALFGHGHQTGLVMTSRVGSLSHLYSYQG